MIQKTAAIILAAGKGTRMKSSMPKVMHKIAGKSMIHHVIDACPHDSDITVVIGPDMPEVAQAVAPHKTVIQQSQNGTGDAARTAREILSGFDGYIFILNGDLPFVQTRTLQNLYESAQKTGLAILGFEAADPTGYGRLVTNGDTVTEIIEEKDCNDTQRAIKLGNAGAYCVRGDKLFQWLEQLSDDNAQGEYYLTDIVSIAANEGVKCAYSLADEAEVMGVNSRAQLAEAEAVMQSHLRESVMAGGVTMVDPTTVYLSMDTQFGQDVVIEPNVVFGAGVRVGSNTHIHAFTHIEQAEIGDNAKVGPFARIRPKSKIGNHAEVGNFIEINRSEFKDGAKSKHLSYIGDAVIGEKSNIGAGTVFANYDGFNKHQCNVGQGVFVGSNSTIVAPVNIGDAAIIAAGSTITKDVKAEALAVERGEQKVIEGKATAYRKKKSA